MMYNEKMLESFSKEYAERCQVTDKITAEMFDANGVLRGLRDKNGSFPEGKRTENPLRWKSVVPRI